MTACVIKLRVLASSAALFALAVGCHGDGSTALTRLADARGLAADLRLQFSQAVDASNRAVLADTDQDSIAFASESEKAKRAVQSDVEAIEPLLRAQAFSGETQTLHEFSARFSEYQELDGHLLTLAVQNTNRKAQALSFGSAGQAATAFRDALGKLAASVPARARCRVDALVAQAVLAVREIQVLHAPHIAERDDDGMTRMEQGIADSVSRARAALTSLEELAVPGAGPALVQARTALDQFQAISKQIVELSRRNSNVLSLDLALRQKPALTAACQDRLRTLQDSLAKRGLKATR